MEDVLCRTFTIDMESYGEKLTIDLIEGGKDIPVTIENRELFVDKYIEYLFEV